MSPSPQPDRAQTHSRETENSRFEPAHWRFELGIWKHSEPARKMFGLPPSPGLAHDVYLQSIHPEDRESFDRCINRTLDTGERFIHEYRVIRGTETLSVTSHGEFFRSGKCCGIAGVSIETTGLRGQQEALANTARLESIARLAGGIAHDYNNLLAGILGGASFLEEVLPETHIGHPILGVIRRSSERAALLTKQLLAYSGKSMTTLRKMNLADAVREGCALAKAVFPPQVNLFLHPPQTGLPAIEGDHGQIRDVVVNLLSNAAEAFGTQTGEIDVAVGSCHLDGKTIERAGKASAACATTGQAAGIYAFIEVRDAGEGMTADVQQKMFEPFFTTRFTGRGLGLSAVHGIVRAHNGVIEVESETGLGTRICVYLPVLAGPETAQTSQRSIWEKANTVLVIDDEEAVRHIVHAALERAGYKVLTASDGVSGLEIFRRAARDISMVLLDVSMPGLSSSKVLDELKKIKPNLSVLITSGYSAGEALSQFPEGSTAGFIQKPFTVRELASAVEQVEHGKNGE